ncbi:MAG: hypothetical protein FWD68_12730 [Alphaproteobacteria bacterium]|nr:hypothetical protein [Alphaproteobacteria bacterium]
MALGSGLTWKVATGVDCALTRNWHVSAEASYTAFKYGASARVPNLADPGHGVMEPDSRTNVTMVKLGIGYSWGAPSARYGSSWQSGTRRRLEVSSAGAVEGGRECIDYCRSCRNPQASPCGQGPLPVLQPLGART